MDTSKWKIAIISTGNDLVDLRAGLAKLFKEAEFYVLAYEFPDYPVDPNLHSHDACLTAVKRADIVILLIDQRYGGFYIGSTGVSITEQEYEEAVKGIKIIIPCIRKKAWHEHYTLFKKEQEIDDDFKKSVKYVDNWDVLEFIEKVRKADIDNFVIPFDSINDLSEHIIGRLKGLTRFILETITRVQVNMVSAMKTSTGMDLSLGDVLQKGYFIEPPFKIKSGEDENQQDIFHYTNKIIENKLGIALNGGTGTGKSTLIAKAFLEHADICFAERSDYLPFFVSLRGKGSDYTFSFDEYIEHSFGHHLKKTVYPYLELNTVNLVFYMDGFDELTEDVQSIDLQTISKSDLFKSSFIFSCRTRFAKDYLNEITFGNTINYIIELEEWSPGVAEKYIKKFCEIHEKDELYSDLGKYFDKNPDLSKITSNPLLLTLFLWVVEQGKMDIPLGIKNTINLFDECIELWIKRDISRIGIDGTAEGREFASHLRKAWQLAAWEIYKSRFDSERHLILQQLTEVISNVSPEIKEVCEKQAFLGLLDISAFGDDVQGMLHEQFLEHLSAYVIAEGAKNNQYPFPESLNYVIRPEINRMIRAIWSLSGSQFKIDTLNNLWTKFTELLGSDDPSKIFARNQATYYLGRIDNEEAYEKLQQAKKSENNMFVRISISFGLIKKGDFEEEQEFFNKLHDDPEWDSVNRGYHLTYYRDVAPSDPPYLDDSNRTWRNTLKALLRHFKSPEKRHIALRRVELLTIRRLIETRKDIGIIDRETLDMIKSIVIGDLNIYNNFPEYFGEGVNAEYQELEKSWLTHNK